MAGRPPAGARLRYLVGGRIMEHRDWVRHDLTDPGWQLRLIGRFLLQLLPFVVVALVVPGIDGLSRALLVLLIVFSSLLTAGIAVDQLRDRRLRQHGLPVKPDEDERWRQQRRY